MSKRAEKVYGPTGAHFARYRDEPVAFWHERLVGEVRLAATRLTYVRNGKCSCPTGRVGKRCRACQLELKACEQTMVDAENALLAALRLLRARIKSLQRKVRYHAPPEA